MSQQNIIDYWVEKASDDIASARDNLAAARFPNAVRDAYFACFHAFSADLPKTESRSKSIEKFDQRSTGIIFGPIRLRPPGKQYDWS